MPDVLFVSAPWPSSEGKQTGGGRTARWPATYVTPIFYPPLFHASAAAVLEDAGYSIEILDCPPQEVTFNELPNILKAKDPILTVFESATGSIPYDLKAVHIAKKVSGSTTAMSGPHVTVLDVETLKESLDLDIVVRGEYDYTILEIVEALEKGRSPKEIEGITYRENGSVRRNPDRPLIQDLDKLPIPAYHLFKALEKYRETVYKTMHGIQAVTSRGCPFVSRGCDFCLFPQTIFSSKWRAMSAGRIVELVKYLHEKFKMREIDFDDDEFAVQKKRLFEFSDLLMKENLDVIWSAQCRCDTVNKEALQVMHQSGCWRILYGVENGDPQMLQKLKGLDVETVKQAFKTSEEVGIDVHGAYMIGNPGETWETVKKTISFAKELNSFFAQFSIATPFPGTRFYDYVRNQGFLVNTDWSDFQGSESSVVSYPELSNRDMERTLVQAYREYYVRPKYLHKMLKRALESRENFEQTIRFTKAFVQRYRAGLI